MVLAGGIRGGHRSGTLVGTVSVFELNNVRYSYGAQVALDGISLAIEAGRRVALLGANGSGKSTLLRLLDALYFPASGTISFHGSSLEPQCFEEDRFAFDFRRRVGLVFQNPDVQLFNPTVFDEVAFAPAATALAEGGNCAPDDEILEKMEIARLKDRVAAPAFRRRKETGGAGLRAGGRSRGAAAR